MDIFAPESVREAAVFLDRNLPGWEHHIDIDTLDMASCADCVLGQLWLEHPALRDKPEPGNMGPWVQPYDAALKILNLQACAAFGSATDKKWRKEIDARLAQPPVRDLAAVDA